MEEKKISKKIIKSHGLNKKYHAGLYEEKKLISK